MLELLRILLPTLTALLHEHAASWSRTCYGAGVTTSTMAADRAGADDDTELEELAPDALGAPERVMAGQCGDQLTDLGIQPRPTKMTA
jgi:hypothetical protein